MQLFFLYVGCPVTPEEIKYRQHDPQAKESM